MHAVCGISSLAVSICVFGRWMWWRMPITKDWNAIMGMMRVETMVFPQKMLDTISISWPIRCHMLYLCIILLMFCVMAVYHIFKFWFHHWALASFALGQGKVQAPAVPDTAPWAVLGADPQKTIAWHHKLLVQEWVCGFLGIYSFLPGCPISI